MPLVCLGLALSGCPREPQTADEDRGRSPSPPPPVDAPTTVSDLVGTGIEALYLASPADPESTDAVISLELGAAIDCETLGDTVRWGVLIDGDRSTATGVGDTEAFGELGVDARIEARCGPDGRLVSNDDRAEVVLDEATRSVIEFRLPVSALPSLTFDWFAYSTKGDEMSRMPAAPEHSTWAFAFVPFF